MYFEQFGLYFSPRIVQNVSVFIHSLQQDLWQIGRLRELVRKQHWPDLALVIMIGFNGVIIASRYELCANFRIIYYVESSL